MSWWEDKIFELPPSRPYKDHFIDSGIRLNHTSAGGTFYSLIELEMFDYVIYDEDENSNSMPDPPGCNYNATRLGLSDLKALRQGLDDCIKIMEEAKHRIE